MIVDGLQANFSLSSVQKSNRDLARRSAAELGPQPMAASDHCRIVIYGDQYTEDNSTSEFNSDGPSGARHSYMFVHCECCPIYVRLAPCDNTLPHPLPPIATPAAGTPVPSHASIPVLVLHRVVQHSLVRRRQLLDVCPELVLVWRGLVHLRRQAVRLLAD